MGTPPLWYGWVRRTIGVGRQMRAMQRGQEIVQSGQRSSRPTKKKNETRKVQSGLRKQHKIAHQSHSPTARRDVEYDAMDDGVWRGCLAGLGHSLARSSLEAQLPTGQGALGGKKARSGLTPAAVLFSRGRPIRAEGGSAAFVEVYYEPLVSFFFLFLLCCQKCPSSVLSATQQRGREQQAKQSSSST